MRQWFSLVLAFALSAAVSLPIAADDLDEEVMAHIVEPCFIRTAKLAGMLDTMSEREALSTLKRTNADQIQTAIAGAQALIQGNSPFEERKMFYDYALSICQENSDNNNKLDDKPLSEVIRDEMQEYEPECYQEFDCWYQTYQLHLGVGM